MRNLITIPAAVLASTLLLAGCGGGGGGDTTVTTPPAPPPTPEEECLAGNGVVYEDGECKTADDLRDEGRDAEVEEREAAAEAEARERMAKENLAQALKLYNGISVPIGDANNPAAGDRAAAYNDAGTPTDAAVDTRILVTIGGTQVPTPVALTEDKKTVVAALHGWDGKRYTAEPVGDGTYEAHVYSNVGEPEMGPKFNSGTDGIGFALDATSGETPALNTLTGYEARVDSPSFDHSAGNKEFELPGNTVRVTLSGSYHGVSGTYYCTPAASGTCAARKAPEGFALGSTADDTNAFSAGGWTFKPTDPNARVTNMPDTIYASYGWWLHKSEDGSQYTASAFADVKGAVPAAAEVNGLDGTATYQGGAAGQYAISSSTGDSGHFTARATLEAAFSDNSTITGTIDNFIGSDGMARDWSIELKEAAIAAEGAIARADSDDTVWTIDGTAAAASGDWSGTLYDNGEDNVPQVATGTFHSTYGNTGNMVGAFGANVQ